MSFTFLGLFLWWGIVEVSGQGNTSRHERKNGCPVPCGDQAPTDIKATAKLQGVQGKATFYVWTTCNKMLLDIS